VGVIVFLGLGSNIGDRGSTLSRAVDEISRSCGTLRRSSTLYDTAPWGNKRQSAFLNQVIEIETHHSPRELLHHCQHIEKLLHRRRIIRWGPRTIDIDILLFGDRIIRERGLTIPHQRLRSRRFVLVPLAELAPDLTVPGTQRTVAELLKACRDESRVTRLS